MQCKENQQEPLKVVVLYSSGHLGSALLFNQLVNMSELEVLALVRADVLPFSRRGLKKLKRHLSQVGWRFGWLLLWQQCILMLGYMVTLCLGKQKHKSTQPAWHLSKKLGIPTFHCHSINDKETIAFLQNLSPDLIISAYFNQILKKQVIDIPKQGVLNIHPGWLPAYKGVMTYLWVLKQGEEAAGVTLRWIDEGIDTGAILMRRRFRVHTGMTQQNVLVLTAIIGASLVRRVARKLLKGQRLEPMLVSGESDQYYPMPGSQEFDRYFKHRRFFRISDMLKHITRKK